VDPVTHGLTGALLAEAGFRQRYGPQATFALTVGALAPDIDVVGYWGQGVAGLEMHRGVTHSLVGGAVVALAVAAIARALGPERRWGPLAALAGLGVFFGHLFLDLVTSFGTQLFLPFSRARPAWDWLFIIDLGFSLPLLAALVTARLTRKVAVARVGCAFLVAYLAVAAIAHGAALAQVREAAARSDLVVRRAAALPQPPSPRRWLGLVETADGYAVGRVDLLGAGPVALERVPMGLPGAGSQAMLVERVRALAPVRTYLWFARFPVVSLQEIGDNQVVEFRDLRFTSRGWRDDAMLRRLIPLLAPGRLEREPFVLRVVLSPSGAVREVTLR
jgi:inner membrane protein